MLKIALTGPESTGKSTLAQQLARHYRTIYVPEYARYYLESFGAEYSEAQVWEMARGQISLEKALLTQASDILFLDTELTVMKVWLENAYQFCPDWLLSAQKNQNYDLYLLMNIDLPWQPDPLREHPHRRAYFLAKYEAELQALGANYRLISGTADQRLHYAIQIIDELLKNI
ncbi:MAG: ATP-binding protein [Microscillaceae bacterium]|jgi:NadR type nicotinamide-nucleotide adenylyltransferase|nr:ATP-binding protein [Microscillaceae bacterium]